MKKLVLGTLMLCLGTLAMAQTPTYEAYLANDLQVSPTVYEFDIYVKQTGATALEIANLQVGLNFNKLIRNGGALTYSLVPGTSEFVSAQWPSSFVADTANGILRIAPRTPPGSGSGTIISATGSGTRFGRFRVTNTVSFATETPNLSWNFIPTPPKYPTKLSAYVSGSATDITVPDSHTVALKNPILNVSISGAKYNDTDGDGTKDGGETGLQDWRIRLSRDGSPVDSVLTAADGSYTFTNLVAGTYVVREEAKTGWIQTSSPDSFSVVISGGTSSTGNDFGNFQLGTIGGTKYDDTNGNGTRDGGEPGMQSWRIRLSKDGSPVDSALTDASGNYSFGNLTAGTYVVSELLQEGWLQTSGPATYSVVVTSGTSSAGNDFGNFRLGTISGTKYDDTDGDGTKDGGEAGLQNWRIRLSKDGSPVDSALTDASGNYSFENLTAGTYVVSELLQEGWAQTSSPATYSIVVTSGTVSAGNDFGNFLLGSIDGTKYDDTNGNGARDGGDPGLQNWRIRLSRDGSQIDSTLTDANGDYSFTNLSAGTYVVSEALQAGWAQTSSPTTHSVVITSGTVSTGNDFGNFLLGSISGTKYNDTDGDGTQDGGEPGLQNWRIRLSIGGSQVDSTLTDVNGSYTFTNLAAGTYVVSEQLQAGWIQTSAPSTYSIVVTSGTASTGNDFGNFHTATISGTKYNDLDGNGVKGGGEPGLQNWKIRLSLSGTQVDSVLTDANGDYSFADLTAGTYVVSEQVQAGWVQTSTPSTHTVVITSGTASTGNDFGNFQLGTIGGAKYDDTNGNGTREGGEPGLQNWRIRLSRDGSPVDSVLTDANGDYSFGNLTAGTYVVSELLQEGWIQTSSPTTYSIVVTSGTASTGNDFGNYKLGSISGLKYNDIDGSGSKDVSEPGMADWRIRLTKSGIPVDSALTDVSGNYSFGNLTAGTYVVSEQLQAGWIQTSTPSTYSIVVTSGTVSVGNNFGNFQAGSISGVKFHDYNKNGTKDAGEPGLQNWRIRLSKSGTQVDSAMTDENGNYAFSNLSAGTYVVSELQQAGWLQTSTPATYSVSIVSGTVSSGNNFGNFRLQLSLKALLEGFYDQSLGTMVQDSARIELHNSTNPWAEVDHDVVVLNANGQATATFRTAANGTPYYIVLRHRNTIETWSASAQSFTASALSYDFTTAANKAYGSNMILKGAAWCVYSGDCAKDGWVDGSDMNVVDNNAAIFAYGYFVSDMNGDSWTDGLDMNFVDNNSASFIYAVTPENTSISTGILASKKLKEVRAIYATRRAPTYEYALMNDRLVSPSEYEFDIVLKGLDDTVVVANTQVGLTISKDVRNGGTLTFSMVPGSSEFIETQVPSSFSVDTVLSMLRIAPRTNPATAAGTRVSKSTVGTRLGRFRVTNSVPFTGAMDLSWNLGGSGGKYPSRLSAYNGAAVDITVPSSFTSRLTNPDPHGEGPHEDLPHVFSLSDNYPNPFNPRTTITFTLPASSLVTLKIYDLLGQEVATLLDAKRVDESVNHVVFDAQSLGSGLYFYRLTAETIPDAGSDYGPQRFVSVRKMVLLK